MRRMEESGGQFSMSLRMKKERMSAIGFIERGRASHWQDYLTALCQSPSDQTLLQYNVSRNSSNYPFLLFTFVCPYFTDVR